MGRESLVFATQVGFGVTVVESFQDRESWIVLILKQSKAIQESGSEVIDLIIVWNGERGTWD